MKKMITIPGISRQKLQLAKKNFICSVSGWRKVFAPNTESHQRTLRPEDKVLVMLAAQSFASLFTDASTGIAFGRDTRPTSAPIEEIMSAVMQHHGLPIHALGVCPSPEISTYVRVSPLAGFCYITASHNPIGYSGIKFGAADGGVLPAEQARKLIRIFETCIDQYSEKPVVLPRPVLSPNHKQDSEEYYFKELQSLSFGASPFSLENKESDIKIVIDMNGSARTRSIDKKWAHYIGVHFRLLNDTPGKIVHTIIPEGEALQDCKKALGILHRKDPRFQLGYLYDTDGDRGNILITDPVSHESRGIATQQYFALLCLCELLWEQHHNNTSKQAVVVNDATSYLVDEIARLLNVRVFRVEVGEANLLAKIQEVTKEGFHVRIAGEGSTGGCIISSAKIRDPLLALTAIYKAYAFNLFPLWFRLSGHTHLTKPSLSEVIASLPEFTTTSSSEKRAIVHVQSHDPVALKQAYERIFLQQYPQYEQMLAAQLGVDSWEQENSCRHRIIKGPGGWKEHPTGGLSIKFKKQQEVVAAIWFRQSGTEPLYRILVDIKGSHTSLERILLEWQRQILLLADGAVTRHH